MYHCPIPDPGDEEGWRLWGKCWIIASVVAAVIVSAIFIFARL